MKIDLTDITFLFLVKLDSIERLENILCITKKLISTFNTNINVLEIDNHTNDVLARLLNKKINYKFIKDIDPVLYKTKYINLMAKGVDTPYISIWDIDIVIDTKVIIEAVMKLRNEYDITYPYNGMCFEVPPIIKSMYLSRMDIRLLYRQMGKMELLDRKSVV